MKKRMYAIEETSGCEQSDEVLRLNLRAAGPNAPGGANRGHRYQPGLPAIPEESAEEVEQDARHRAAWEANRARLFHRPASGGEIDGASGGPVAEAVDHHQALLDRVERNARLIEQMDWWHGGAGDAVPPMVAACLLGETQGLKIWDLNGNVTDQTPENRKSKVKDYIELYRSNAPGREHYFRDHPDDTRRDGNCFFHAFLTARDGHAPEWKDIQDARKQTADYFRQHADQYAYALAADPERDGASAVQTELQRQYDPVQGGRNDTSEDLELHAEIGHLIASVVGRAPLAISAISLLAGLQQRLVAAASADDDAALKQKLVR